MMAFATLSLSISVILLWIYSKVAVEKIDDLESEIEELKKKIEGGGSRGEGLTADNIMNYRLL